MKFHRISSFALLFSIIAGFGIVHAEVYSESEINDTSVPKFVRMCQRTINRLEENHARTPAETLRLNMCWKVMWNYVPEEPGEVSCHAKVRNPYIEMKHVERDGVRGNQFMYYNFRVRNQNSFLADLFRLSPELPPCGLNENSSRSWVGIYDGETDQRYYGFCALEHSDGLERLWFAIPLEDEQPKSFYMELEDRQCGKKYRSNTIEL